MTPQFGPHRWDAGEYDVAHTDEFRGLPFVVRDLSGARFVDCDLTGAKIIDACVVDVDISGYVEHLVVNGIDVTDYVEAESLNARHPERVQLAEIRSADGFRAMWITLDGLWRQVGERFERLGAGARDDQVNGEWSYVQTLRHLIFIADSWASRAILDIENPFHRLGLPQSAYPRADAIALGMEIEAEPTFDEVLAARTDRWEIVRRILDGLDDSDLGRLCERSPAPGYPEESRPVWECLSVVMNEECEHYRFATRDLTLLESRSTP